VNRDLLLRLDRSRELIASRCGEVVTLEDAAREACLSPYHYHRLFTQTFGQTPHDFLTERRLDRARLLLARSDLTVTEVCLEAGYVSLGTFSTRFRRLVGCSPREYREGSRRFWHVAGLPAYRLVPMCFLRSYGQVRKNEEA
jgi:AraC-like DNA-binding protein